MGRFSTTIVVAALAALGPLSACATAAGTANGRLSVAATTSQVSDFTRIVGGALIDVHEVVGHGVDPHEYSPTPADLESIRHAKVVVINGVGLESWLGDAVKSTGTTARIIDTSATVAIDAGDPHIWTDPQNAKKMVAAIEAGLSTVDPSHAATYVANATAYAAQLDTLDHDIAARLATLPNTKLVTNHDSLGYYVAHFGLSYVGSVIPSFDSAAEPSARDLAALVAAIKAQGVRAIFTESTLPPKVAEALASEAGVKVVSGADAIYADSLGPDGSDGDTYLKMMLHNTDTIVRNLT